MSITKENRSNERFKANDIRYIFSHSPLSVKRCLTTNKYLNATQLGYFLGLTPVEVNRLLAKHGLVRWVRINGEYRVTDLGAQYAQGGSFTKAGYWDKSVLELLRG